MRDTVCVWRERERERETLVSRTGLGPAVKGALQEDRPLVSPKGHVSNGRPNVTS